MRQASDWSRSRRPGPGYFFLAAFLLRWRSCASEPSCPPWPRRLPDPAGASSRASAPRSGAHRRRGGPSIGPLSPAVSTLRPRPIFLEPGARVAFHVGQDLGTGAVEVNLAATRARRASQPWEPPTLSSAALDRAGPDPLPSRPWHPARPSPPPRQLAHELADSRQELVDLVADGGVDGGGRHKGIGARRCLHGKSSVNC